MPQVYEHQKGYGKCEICGNTVQSPIAKKCNLCWEVMHRIDDFLESEKAKDIIVGKLVKLGVIKC